MHTRQTHRSLKKATAVALSLKRRLRTHAVKGLHNPSFGVACQVIECVSTISNTVTINFAGRMVEQSIRNDSLGNRFFGEEFFIFLSPSI